MAHCGHLSARPPREKLLDAASDACWPATMIILISNFCAPPHGEEEEVGREMRAFSLGRSPDLIIWKRYLLVGAVGVYLELRLRTMRVYARRSGKEGENEEKAAPGSGSSERFQFSAVMGYVVCECVTGQARVGVEHFLLRKYWNISLLLVKILRRP